MDYADMSNFPFFVRARFDFIFNSNSIWMQLPVASCQLPVAILACWRFAGWPLLGSADSDATRAEATLCQPTSSSTYSGGAIGVVLVVRVGVGVGAGAGAGPLCVQSNYFGVGHIKRQLQAEAVAELQSQHRNDCTPRASSQRDSAPLVAINRHRILLFIFSSFHFYNS